MKFSDYPILFTDKHGDSFVRDDTIMVGSTEHPCAMCGKPTKYIDICYEDAFCSDECLESFTEQLFDGIDCSETCRICPELLEFM